MGYNGAIEPVPIWKPLASSMGAISVHTHATASLLPIIKYFLQCIWHAPILWNQLSSSNVLFQNALIAASKAGFQRWTESNVNIYRRTIITSPKPSIQHFQKATYIFLR